MPTIAEENKKILRQALDVIVGMDIPFEDISSVSVSGNYPGSSGVINQAPQRANLMDLSNGGFLNDGLSTPLDSNTGGFVSQINTDLDISVTLANSSDSDIVIIGYLNGDIHKWTFNGSGANRTITIPADPKRIIVSRIICGAAFWFDNANLISCNLQLRAVETKVDNPELQMSEIDIEGYEPNDITDSIGYIGTGYPIYYTSGYQDDMAPLRRFYLGEPIEFDKSVVKIKGYDATYFLDDEFGGVYIGDPDEWEADGVNAYFNTIAQIVTDAGVDLEYINNYTEWVYNSREISCPMFIPKKSKRAVISQMVNFFRAITWVAWDSESEDMPVYINYVDAGIPKMWTGKDEASAKVLDLISRPKVIIDPKIKRVEMNMYVPDVDLSSSLIEALNVSDVKIYETTDPYYSFTVSSGTVTRINPYTCKITGNGNINLSGRALDLRPPQPDPEDYLPVYREVQTGGVTVSFEDFYGGSILGPAIWFNWASRIFRTLLNRSNISYEFTFRGDPNLQPRDYIRADIDGSGTLIDMTIDNIELKHEGGGTTSTIVARKGFI